MSGTSHSYDRLLSGVTYTVSVRAVNDAGPGPFATTTVTTISAPGDPRGLTAEARGNRRVEVSWFTPSDTGGSSISGYQIQYSREALQNHSVHGNSDAWWSSIFPVSGTSDSYDRLLSGVTYTVSVRAVNEAGTGRIATTTVTTTACPTDKKFKTKRNRYRRWIIHVIALQDFTTIDGREIQEGDEGGKVSSDDNLSQTGCSWIFKDAEVTGNAHVSGNAVVYGGAKVYDRAQVYGDARVYDTAKVYGDVKVYDGAQVFDDASVYDRAQVYADATVYDKAKVYGSAKLFGSAEFSESMEADEDDFDGTQEHPRAGRRLYSELFSYFVDYFGDCVEDVGAIQAKYIPTYVRDLLSKDQHARTRSGDHLDQCRIVISSREIARVLTKMVTPDWYDAVFTITLTLLPISIYLKSLIEIGKTARSLEDLAEILIAAERMMEQYEKCDMSLCVEDP